MKVMTIFGTRPEIIRLSLVMQTLDRHCEHVAVHTGQNFEKSLSEIFLKELGVREPDHRLGIRALSFGEQAGRILSKTDRLLEDEKPDRVLILGDTNSGLSALAAARKGIPVFHMEAGNRCFDDRVPEEVNRRVIDHSSAVLLPYTNRSKENLVREGIERERIYVTGNPIYEVLEHFSSGIAASGIGKTLNVEPGRFLLATVHRAENVDAGPRLSGIFGGLELTAEALGIPLLVSVHPRTSEKLEAFGVKPDTGRVRLLDPLGFFDFVRLEKDAACVLTDSGTVQEECAIYGIPNVTLRDVTERPETLECGANVISGGEPEDILAAAKLAVAEKGGWTPPQEYLAKGVARTVAKIVLGNASLRKHR